MAMLSAYSAAVVRASAAVVEAGGENGGREEWV